MKTKNIHVQYLDLKNQNDVLAKYEYNNLISLLEKMHGTSDYIISKTFAVKNDNLHKAFEAKSIQLTTWLEEPNIYHDQTWKNDKYYQWRFSIMDHLELYADSFPYNINNPLKVIPVFHSICSEESAYKICETGFAT